MVKIIHDSTFFSSLQGIELGFVPTMGNLHDGHLELLKKSLEDNQATVFSIFVNPTQFSADEDLDAYPRTVEEDIKKIEAISARYSKDVYIYIPSEKDIYPEQDINYIQVPEFETILEGEVRPTHFRGVATVVFRFFHLIQPQKAYFGKKDYQQYIIVRDMAERLQLKTQIIGVEIVREHSGLAMSSRNNYLTDSQKQEATVLYKSLQEVGSVLKQQGLTEANKLIQEKLKNSNFNYLAIRDARSFQKAQDSSEEFVIVGNFQIGTTRLLDNLEVLPV